MAWDMLNLNTLLPRYLWETIIDWKLVSLYFKRNNLLTGILFYEEYTGYDKLDPEEYPSSDTIVD